MWDGLLNDDAKALVELVARKGAGDWEGKLEELRARLGLRLEAKSAEDLRICWDEAAPLVKAKLSERPSMPCGHTCGTCPTRSDCHLEGLLDMEDFGSGAGERQRAAAGKGTLSRRPEGSPPSANL